jgi:hypothetical protein
MLRQLEQIPNIKDHVKHLNQSHTIQLACGYDSKLRDTMTIFEGPSEVDFM